MTRIARESSVFAVLKKRLKGIVVIAGVGNTLRCDDGAGPRLVEILRERLDGTAEDASSIHLIDCRETPENYIGCIAQQRPETVVVVDSASLGLPAGEVRILEADDLPEDNPSTHRMSPALFMNRLKDETGADVFLLAVQPAMTTFGEGLSVAVHRAVTELANHIESMIRPK